MTPTASPADPLPTESAPTNPAPPLLVAAIAEALGPRWSREPDPDNPEHGGFLVEQDGMRLSVVVGTPHARTKAERDTIRVMLDADGLRAHLPNVAYPVLRVPVGRSAESVAQSIRKRLLPQAQGVLAAARERAQAAAFGTRHQARILDAVAALSGGEVVPGSPAMVRVGDVGDAVNAQVEFDTERDAAQFHVDVPTSLAPLLAELIGRLRAVNPTQGPPTGA